MSLDINEIVADMLNAIKVSVKDDWKLVKKTASIFLQSRKERLDLLASLRISNEIDESFFKKRMEDEKEILESELHAVAVINKVAAQNAANAAMKILDDTITAALKIV